MVVRERNEGELPVVVGGGGKVGWCSGEGREDRGEREKRGKRGKRESKKKEMKFSGLNPEFITRQIFFFKTFGINSRVV